MGTLLGVCTAATSAAGGVLIEKYLRHTPQQHQHLNYETANQVTAVWKQQAALACFSALFATLYLLILERQDGWRAFAPLNWDALIVFIMVLQAALGIVVALAIKKFGIVARLVLGSLSVCLCIVAEALLFGEPVHGRELLLIMLVVTGSNQYALPGSQPPQEHIAEEVDVKHMPPIPQGEALS